MKPEYNYKSQPPPRTPAGLPERSNATPISRLKSTANVHCDHCGIAFKKPLAWIKRSARHFCSTACHNEHRKLRTGATCCVCGKGLDAKPSITKLVSTCSHTCSLERKRRFLTTEKAIKAGRGISYKEKKHGMV